VKERAMRKEAGGESEWGGKHAERGRGELDL